MGRIEIIRDFFSQPEDCSRTLRLWLPDAYDQQPDRRFPVVYLHDGQNLFDHPESALEVTWGVDSAFEALLGEGRVEPWIAVAIDHRGPERLGDYSPWPEPIAGDRANADRYVAFLSDHLKPYVDQRFRTRVGPAWTATVGSSMGGLVSLYLALRRPELFGRVGAFSPSVMWSSRRMFSEWNRSPASGLPRIYLDAGADERLEKEGQVHDYGGAVGDFAEHLRRLGFDERQLKVVLEPGGQHFEADWRRRLPEALAWLLSATPAS